MTAMGYESIARGDWADTSWPKAHRQSMGAGGVTRTSRLITSTTPVSWRVSELGAQSNVILPRDDDSAIGLATPLSLCRSMIATPSIHAVVHGAVTRFRSAAIVDGLRHFGREARSSFRTSTIRPVVVGGPTRCACRRMQTPVGSARGLRGTSTNAACHPVDRMVEHARSSGRYQGRARETGDAQPTLVAWVVDADTAVHNGDAAIGR